jgi:hypothetical protein
MALGDITRQSFLVRGLILRIFLLGMAVWFGLQNLNNLALGDTTKQNFLVMVRVLILGIIFWLAMAVWFGLQNLNKLALGDITRQNFPVSCLI